MCKLAHGAAHSSLIRNNYDTVLWNNYVTGDAIEYHLEKVISVSGFEAYDKIRYAAFYTTLLLETSSCNVRNKEGHDGC